MTFGSAQSVKRTHAYNPPPPMGLGLSGCFIFLLFIFYLHMYRILGVLLMPDLAKC